MEIERLRKTLCEACPWRGPSLGVWLTRCLSAVRAAQEDSDAPMQLEDRWCAALREPG